MSGATVNLFAQVQSSQPGENILLSPTSIDFALGMTENGAAGETLSQMEETVNGGLSVDTINPIMKHLSNRYMNAAEVEWNIANSIWFKNDGQVAMGDEFLDKVVGYYGADIFLAPFDSQTLDDINGWVNDKTKGMIPNILDQIHENARMYLVNAIAFEGEWAEQYEEDKITEGRTFTNADGSESDVTMMTSTENRYFEIAGGQGFLKPYKGREYSFVGILPAEGDTPEDLIAKIQKGNVDLSKTLREAGVNEVHVTMPEFTNDYYIEMNDTYQNMGMDIPFNEAKADFSPMMHSTDGSPANIWIGRIIHKTHIEVDRKGTKAAASTVVEMRYKNAIVMDESKCITLDRPFVYAVVENETGLPVFIGCQNYIK
ncbi:MAG: serpin family protein [Lachnospiraceae bacterium]|nr:serpin family protein [Lachnospiraceae bacterium]